MDIVKNLFKYNTFFTHPKKMKTIEETFKAEKEISEEFFKNRKLKTKNEKSYPYIPFGPREPSGEYRSVRYYGEIKNPRELNVKNSFDLIEYLKPCLVYIASDNNKEKIIDGIDVWNDSENFYYEMGLFLINGHCPAFMYESVGFNWCNRFKEELKVYQPLNGDKIKRYIENECRNKNNTFSFNDKPIRFEFLFKIRLSYDYIMVLMNEWVANIFLGQMDLPNRGLFHNNNNKKIINAEKFFKEDECVICLTNPPNILFCNCGYLCLCVECSKTGESLEKCPICKTGNTNLRIIE